MTALAIATFVVLLGVYFIMGKCCSHVHDIYRVLSLLLVDQRKIMATGQELVNAVAALKANVESFPGVVDGLEARITAAIAAAGGVPADVQAAIDTAFADATAALATGQAAVADALDGVDEAAVPPAP